jgi:hypothetical protein
LEFNEIVRVINCMNRCDYKYDPELLEIREKLYDWIVVVTNKLNFSIKCYFLITEIIDILLRKIRIINEDLKLIAITIIFIISKYEEIKPLSMKKLIVNVAHDNFSPLDIVNTEIVILKVLHYKIPSLYEIDFFYLFVLEFSDSIIVFKRQESDINERMIGYRRQNCVDLGSKKKEFKQTMDIKKVIDVYTSINEEVIKNIIFHTALSLYKLVKISNYSGYQNNLSLCCGIIYISYKLAHDLYKKLFTFNLNVLLEHLIKLGIDLKSFIEIANDIESIFCKYKFNDSLIYFQEFEILKYF